MGRHQPFAHKKRPVTERPQPQEILGRAQTAGGGVEYTFEAVGMKLTAEQAFQCLRAGGTATIIGMVPFGTKIELNGYDMPEIRDWKWEGRSGVYGSAT